MNSLSSRPFSVAALTVGIVALTGCGPSVNPAVAARVSGTISYKGTPIRGGTLRMYGTQGGAYLGTIAKDGTYEATDVGVGELVVTVDTEGVNKHGSGGSAESKRRQEADAKTAAAMAKQMGKSGGGGGPPVPEPDLYVKIPGKYANPKTSPLTVTLKSGRQIVNLELTD